MKCDSCKAKATIFYTQVAEGEVKKFALCESCADEKGVTKPEGLLMAEELLKAATSPVEEENEEEGELVPMVGEIECSSCNFTLENYRKVGRLGCPDCYQAFASEISQRLPSLHRGIEHTGYVPHGMLEMKEMRAELGTLEERLAAAIEEEDFENAAALRDQISELKSSVGGGVK